jgi:hypothetical protein
VIASALNTNALSTVNSRPTESCSHFKLARVTRVTRVVQSRKWCCALSNKDASLPGLARATENGCVINGLGPATSGSGRDAAQKSLTVRVTLVCLSTLSGTFSISATGSNRYRESATGDHRWCLSCDRENVMHDASPQ